MSIDFPCSQCHRTIRVPDGSEGKKTKCPKCDEVQRIPGTETDAMGGESSGSGFPAGGEAEWDNPAAGSAGSAGTVGPGGLHPPDPHAQPGNPFGDSPDTSNPFASPAAAAANVARASQVSRDAAKATLMGPAIATIVVSVLSWLLFGASFLVQLFVGMTDMLEQPGMEDPAARAVLYGIFLGMPVVMTICTVITVAAMTRAMAVRNYGFVMAGFILPMIPVSTCYCCVLALPFSIWGIVVLCDDSVKAAFRLP